MICAHGINIRFSVESNQLLDGRRGVTMRSEDIANSVYWKCTYTIDRLLLQFPKLLNE